MNLQASLLSLMFSVMHSLADTGSFTAYLAPLCSMPWNLPEVPEHMSDLS